MTIRTAFVSTYPPQRCGIGTFTSDLAAVSGAHEIVALQPADQSESYPVEVRHRIRRDVASDATSVVARVPSPAVRAAEPRPERLSQPAQYGASMGVTESPLRLAVRR